MKPAPPAPSAATGPSPEQVWLWGRTALVAALVAALGMTLATAWWVQEWVLALPAVVVAVPALVWVYRRPTLNFVLVVAGFVFIARSEDGLQFQEVLYGLYYISFLVGWYGQRLLYGERIVFTRTDRVVAFLLPAGLVSGIVLGALFGAAVGDIRGDALGFGMLAFYFPAKEYCRTQRYGPEVLVALTAWVGLYVAVGNFLLFREILLAATQAWEVADARPGYNALQLMVPSLGALALLISVRGTTMRAWAMRAGLLGVFGLCFSALILIKYRGFWVGFAFGVALLFLFLRGRSRWRLVQLIGVGGGTVVALAFVFFGDLATLIFSGTLDRLATLSDAATSDVSLINRFVESRAIWEKIRVNPVLGYGFGVEYDYFTLIHLGTMVRFHVHNGYVGLWYKLGAWGTVLGFAYLGLAAWAGLRAYWSRTLPTLHGVYALVAAVSLLALAPTIGSENPFFAQDQMFTIALMAALAVGLRQRYAREVAGVPAPQP